jgi:hypothetical protein
VYLLVCTAFTDIYRGKISTISVISFFANTIKDLRQIATGLYKT